VSAFLTSLAHAECSPTTQNQALQSLLMFYREVHSVELGRIDALRAKRREHVRYAPTREETAALLTAVRDTGCYPVRLIVHLLYGCGLRVNEPLELRIKDVDIANSRLVVRQAKGGKDRVVPMPCSLVDPVRKQVAVAAALWQQDAAAGVPVPLPDRLEVKYPSYAHARAWYWLFPLRTRSEHPRTGATVRWHVLDTAVQRAVRDAAETCGLTGLITPHCLRHAYATHAMQAGANVRDVQQVMGHAHLDTTMGYLHAESGRVKSPLDAIGVAL
jgi:site-specific recombinase XerD